jgi:hypothetical protein
MWDSWASNGFWFNYAISKGWDVDGAYWSALHESGDEKLENGNELDR